MNADFAISEFMKHEPHRFRFLESISLRRNIRESKADGYDAMIVLLDRPDEDGERLLISCVGSRDVRIGNVDGLVGLLVEVTSMRDRGLEGINYRVADSEHGVFSLFCSDFSVHEE